MSITRTCACGCGRTFTPPRTRPAQVYLFGHKKHAGIGRQAAITPKIEDHEPSRRALNYRMALDSAERELRTLDAEIERLDDEAEAARKVVAGLLEQKDRLVERHAAVTAAIEGLGKALGL